MKTFLFLFLVICLTGCQTITVIDGHGHLTTETRIKDEYEAPLAILSTIFAVGIVTGVYWLTFYYGD